MLSYRIDLVPGGRGVQMTAMKDIHDWYKTQPLWVRRVNFWFLLLFSFALVVGLTKSGPEFRAIAWHYRHGSRVTVNGVTFPVYYWYAPEDGRDQFHVLDHPGPLRPTDDGATMFSIDGWRHNDDMDTPEELVRREMRMYSGDPDLTRFQWSIRSQALECMQEHKGSWSVLFCYGDGPVYSVFFSGNDDALNRLKQTISEAK
jgi:hypothetical protein